MKEEEDLVVRKCDHFEEGVFTIREEALLEPMVVEMGCAEAKTYYVDTDGCGTQLANPANSPPKNGFVRMIMRYAAVLLMSLMMLAWPTACNKQPTPTPGPQPTEKINDTLEWMPRWSTHWYPPFETIDSIRAKPNFKKLIIALKDRDIAAGEPIDYTTEFQFELHRAREEVERTKTQYGDDVDYWGAILVNEITNPNVAPGTLDEGVIFWGDAMYMNANNIAVLEATKGKQK